MFVWTSGFQKSLAQTEFNMFLDEWTSANERPECLCLFITCQEWVLSNCVLRLVHSKRKWKIFFDLIRLFFHLFHFRVRFVWTDLYHSSTKTCQNFGLLRHAFARVDVDESLFWNHSSTIRVPKKSLAKGLFSITNCIKSIDYGF